MHVVITGGAGFLGRRLVDRLVARGRIAAQDGREHRIDRITLIDTVAGPPWLDPRVVTLTGDLADPGLLKAAITVRTTSVFHLAAVVSGAAEDDFDLGVRVNIDASRALLERCRTVGRAPRFVFASSVAVFGGDLPAVVPDSLAPTPQSSYGMEKAVAELLVNDYSRRGWIDGRAFRLPTISVRPGKPNAARSSFASGIIREPLNGEETTCPVSRDARLWLLSPAAVIDCLLHGHDVPGSAFGGSRMVNLPGVSVTVGEMVAALHLVAGEAVTARIRWQPDVRVQRVVASWPGNFETARARTLGFQSDRDFDGILRQYLEESGLKARTLAPSNA